MKVCLWCYQALMVVAVTVFVCIVLAALIGGWMAWWAPGDMYTFHQRITALESRPWTIHADKCVQFKEDAGETRVERLAKAHILGEADAAKYPRVTLVYDLWPDGRVDYNCINWANYRKGGGR